MINRGVLNGAIKGRAKDIFKNNLLTILIVGIVYTFVNGILNDISDGNIFVSLIVQFLSVVISASSFSFYFRTYNKGIAEIKDTYEIFTYKNSIKKLMSIFIAMTIIRTLLQLMVWILLFIPVINIIYALAMYFISFLFFIVYSLFVINQDYPTVYYLRASIKYMGPYVLNYFLFILGVIILPIIIISVLQMFGKTGYNLATLLSIPLTSFVYLCQAGYVASIVPDEWYAGTANFK